MHTDYIVCLHVITTSAKNSTLSLHDALPITITQTAGSTITETNLALRAGGAITLNEANDVTTLAATSTAGSEEHTSALQLRVGSVCRLLGESTTSKTVPLVASTGV